MVYFSFFFFFLNEIYENFVISEYPSYKVKSIQSYKNVKVI